MSKRISIQRARELHEAEKARVRGSAMSKSSRRDKHLETKKKRKSWLSKLKERWKSSGRPDLANVFEAMCECGHYLAYHAHKAHIGKRKCHVYGCDCKEFKEVDKDEPNSGI